MSAVFKITSPQDIAMEYGGNKQKIATAAKNGIISATDAVLAGMFIDRTRNAATEEGQSQTVADEVFAPQQSNVGAAPAAGQGVPSTQPTPAPGVAPTPQLAQAPMPQGMAMGGMTSLNVPSAMYDYAPGGLVAFAAGDPVDADAVAKELRIAEEAYKTLLENARSEREKQNATAWFKDKVAGLTGEKGSRPSIAQALEEPEYNPRPSSALPEGRVTPMIDMDAIMGKRTQEATGQQPWSLSTDFIQPKFGAPGAQPRPDGGIDAVIAKLEEEQQRLSEAQLGDPAPGPVPKNVRADSAEGQRRIAAEQAAFDLAQKRAEFADADPMPGPAAPKPEESSAFGMPSFLTGLFDPSERKGANLSRLERQQMEGNVDGATLAFQERQQMTGRLPYIEGPDDDPMATSGNTSSYPRAVMQTMIEKVQRGEEERAAAAKATAMADAERKQMTGELPTGLSAAAMANAERKQMTGSGLGATLAGQERLQMTGELPTAKGGLGTLTGQEVIDMLGERHGTGANEYFISDEKIAKQAAEGSLPTSEAIAKVNDVTGYGEKMNDLNAMMYKIDDEATRQKKLEEYFKPSEKGEFRKEMEALVRDRKGRFETARKEAFNFGLIRAGLGMLAQGGGQTALQAFGKAAAPAIDTYVKEMKDLKKEDRELLKLGLAMEQMDDKQRMELNKVMAQAYTDSQAKKIIANAQIMAAQTSASKLGFDAQMLSDLKKVYRNKVNPATGKLYTEMEATEAAVNEAHRRVVEKAQASATVTGTAAGAQKYFNAQAKYQDLKEKYIDNNLDIYDLGNKAEARKKLGEEFDKKNPDKRPDPTLFGLPANFGATAPTGYTPPANIQALTEKYK